MERIEKFLRKLSRQERERVAECIRAILAGTFDHLDLKKLKGHRDFYRVRTGDVRIIFSQKNGKTRIIAVERRGDTTYSSL